MSDFLTRLVQRQFGQLSTIEPRLPSLFAASATAAPLPVIEEVVTVDSRLQDGAARVPSQVAPPPFVHSNREPARVSRRPDNEDERPVRGPGVATDFPRAVLESDTLAVAPLVAPPVRPMTTLHGAEPAVPPRADLDSPALVRSPVATRTVASAPNDATWSAATSIATVPPLVKTAAVEPQAAPPRLETKPVHGGAIAADRTDDAEAPIQVTIGRIEVTALTQAAPAKRGAVLRKPALSLDEYLARRQRRPS